MNPALVELPVTTGDGIFVAHYTEKGLAELDWPNSGWAGKAGKAGRADLPVSPGLRQPIPATVRAWHRLTEAALKKVLAGKPAGELPPLDWAGKTEFQKAVWRVMLKIPAGKTKSYGEVALAIGKSKAVRAVGGACGANPIPVLVPCHRILAANQKIGGFTGGLDRKRDLLAREGVRFFSAVK